MSLDLDALSSLDAEVASLKKEFEKGGGKPSSDNKKGWSLFANSNLKPIVLAVDDKPDILNSLKSILYGECRFFGVTSAVAAFEFLERHETPDLYIFDIEMPGINGFELARAIERMGKKTVYMFLTSNSDRESLLEAINCGATDFIVKPCRNKVVLQKFHNIFGE